MVKQGGRTQKVVSADLLKSLFSQQLSERAICSYLRKLGIEISQATVHRRLKALGCGKYRGQAPPKKLDARAERMLSRLIRVHGVRTAPKLQKEMASHGFEVSRTTIWRALKANRHLRLQRPRQRPFMTAVQRTARFEWAKSVKLDWTAVYFGDEKTFDLDGPIWRPKIWCDQRDPPNVLPRKGKQQARVVVFGCFSKHRVPDLVEICPSYKSANYCEALQQTLTRGSTILHDRHPVHMSKFTQEFMRKQKLHAVAFPAKAADINPIENLWGIVAKRVYASNKVYLDADSLLHAVKSVWADVQRDDKLRGNLVGSMPKRVSDMVRMKGGCIKY
jgi:arginine repressor